MRSYSPIEWMALALMHEGSIHWTGIRQSGLRRVWSMWRESGFHCDTLRTTSSASLRMSSPRLPKSSTVFAQYTVALPVTPLTSALPTAGSQEEGNLWSSASVQGKSVTAGVSCRIFSKDEDMMGGVRSTAHTVAICIHAVRKTRYVVPARVL